MVLLTSPLCLGEGKGEGEGEGEGEGDGVAASTTHAATLAATTSAAAAAALRIRGPLRGCRCLRRAAAAMTEGAGRERVRER